MSLDKSLEELKRRLALEPGHPNLRTQFEQSHFRVHGLGPYPAINFEKPIFPSQYGDYYLYEEKRDCIDQVGSYPVRSYHGRRINSLETIQLRTFPVEKNDEHYSLFTELTSQFQMTPTFENTSILPIVDFDIFDNQHFYIARACPEGQGLLSYLKTSPGLQWRLNSFLEIARACQDIHKELIIHGSLRAENIFVSESGRAHLWFWDDEWTRLLNSHISRIYSIPIASIAIAKRHMASQSPEYMNADEIVVPSDIYQLGVLLFETLTEQISGQQRSDSLQSIMNSKAPTRILKNTRRGALIDQRVCDKLQKICNKAMSPKPEDRYQTVTELLDDTQEILQGHHEPRYKTPRS